MLIGVETVFPKIAALIVLLLPIGFSLWSRVKTLRIPITVQKEIWGGLSGYARPMLVGTVASWWTIWQFSAFREFIRLRGSLISSKLSASELEALFFWIPPLASLGIFLINLYLTERRLLNLHWSFSKLVWRAFCRLASFVIPLLMVATAFESLMNHQLRGIAWLLSAGLIAKIGTGILRSAEGLRLNSARSGEIRNRAMGMAQEMGISIRRVFIVPAGKGHLTNAYGMSDAIGVTDNLGKHLSKDQIKFILAHELAHVKLKHGRKELFLVIGIYAFLAVLLLLIPDYTPSVKPILAMPLILSPVMLMYWSSRVSEFAADHEAIQFTGDPETAIRALAILHQTAEIPSPASPFTRLFRTHPFFSERFQSIAYDGKLSTGRMTVILADEGITDAGIPAA